ncbi:hypothetical protein C8R45DRAFT_1017434 [Mycena sanguinolenta]|nr:hypothetical protein C8R45DRAFT_1017434 [Mycena sanguinolenta]
MDDWFFVQKTPSGWGGYPNQIDRRCYPNSRGRGVHIWGSTPDHQGEPRVVAGFASFERLRVCEMYEFLRILYKHISTEWVLVKAQGSFFDADIETGGKLRSFPPSVKKTKSADDRVLPNDNKVVEDGHYMWFKCLSRDIRGGRLAEETPEMRTWILTSRVVTAPGSVNASGSCTPSRSESIRRERRMTDGRCRVTGRLSPERGEARGQDWTALHCAHVIPLAWSDKPHLEQMFSAEALELVENLHQKDLLDNTILMDVRAHVWFDDYRFGIWPVQENGTWYGKIFRFEYGSCDVDGEWLLAAAAPATVPLPPYGQQETSVQREAREQDEKRRAEDQTKYDLTNVPVLREVLKVHFETCLHWHVKGMGWHK